MNTLTFNGWLLLSALPSLGLLAFMLSSRSVPTRRAAFVLVLASLVLAAVWVALAGWLFRDGLGPGAMASEGAEARVRFLRDTGIPFAALGLIAIAGFVLRPRGAAQPSD